MIRNRREIKIIIYVAVVILIFQFAYRILIHSDTKSTNSLYLSGKNSEIDLEDKISYEDIKFINYEARRKGPGEQGVSFNLTDPKEIVENEKWYKIEGFYVTVSEKISVDRALPDRRPAACKSKKYLRTLPRASVVVTFHNEVWNVLLRCIHSIVNRSPPQLLYEIILINDASTYENLGNKLEEYIQQDIFDGKIKLHINNKREGLIRGRMIGARLAQGEVVVFLDSHMEVNTGWLPPLLDLIAHNPTWAAVPQVDGLFHKDLTPTNGGYGMRGHFDWSLTYHWYPTLPDEHPELGQNFDLPCMTGGAYAINREYFFYLEGYDEAMDIWNGENYELSFKLWLCPGDKPPGGMQRVPCSRINHLSKMWSAHRKAVDDSDFVGKNLKRVVEVWFDDYKKYFYGYNVERYAKIDAGDLSKQFAFKERMKCKPFQYYLDHVATQLLKDYPLLPKFNYGGNLMLKSKNLCLGLDEMNFKKPVVLKPCSDDPKNPTNETNFVLTPEKEIRYNSWQIQCLDAGFGLAFYGCHKLGGNQAWTYNPINGLIKNSNVDKCLTGRNLNENIYLEKCDENNENQKWSWGIGIGLTL